MIRDQHFRRGLRRRDQRDAGLFKVGCATLHASPGMLTLRDEDSQYKSIRRTSVAFPRYGRAAVSSGMDRQLLAGVGIYLRFCRFVLSNHPVPDEKRSE